jgi:hypothetical protein
MRISKLAVLVFLAVSLGSSVLAADGPERVYVPYTQAVGGDPPTASALFASNSNDFLISYVTTASSRRHPSNPPSICPVGQTPISELKIVVPYDTTFLGRFSSPADRDAFILERIADINATIRKTEPNGNRRVSLAFSWLVPYTSHGVREDDFRWETTSPEILAMKKNYNAVVAFWVGERGDFAGIASSPANGDSSLAWEVLAFDAASEGVASALFGLTLGMNRQLQIEPNIQPPYAHEYSTQNFYTASADPSVCLPACKRADIWSSPLILVNGEPAGKIGVAEDNRVLSQGFQTLGAQTVCVSGQ